MWGCSPRKKSNPRRKTTYFFIVVPPFSDESKHCHLEFSRGDIEASKISSTSAPIGKLSLRSTLKNERGWRREFSQSPAYGFPIIFISKHASSPIGGMDRQGDSPIVRSSVA